MPVYTSDLTLIPDDVYQRIAEQLKAALYPEMANLNGDDYSVLFPAYLSSLESLMGQQLRLGGKETYGQFPRLSYLLKGASPFILDPIRVTHSIAESNSLQAFFTSYTVLADLLSRVEVPISDSTTMRELINSEFAQLERLSSSIVRSAWLANNINQQQRAAQLAFVEDGLNARLAYACELLTRWCQQRGYTWSIRPPISFQSSATAALYERSALAGIHDQTWHLSSAMQYVLAGTPEDHRDRLYPLQHSDYRGQFQHWEHRAAYGVITKDSYHEIAVIPRLTPSQLYSRFDDGIPYYTDVSPGLSPHDSIANISRVNATYVDDIAPQPTRVDEDIPALVLNYICLSYSVFVATIPMGKGNHKPAWTNSPLNQSLIRGLHAIQRPLLQQLRDSL